MVIDLHDAECGKNVKEEVSNVQAIPLEILQETVAGKMERILWRKIPKSNPRFLNHQVHC